MVISGHPKIDHLKTTVTPDNYDNLWPRKKNENIKRIIWSPHWSTHYPDNTSPAYSTFLRYKDNFLQLLKSFPSIDFALRGHPFLWNNLKEREIMTQAQIDDYIHQLIAHPNALVEFATEEYGPLFHSSDAMITDGLSFLGEYPEQKPLLHTIANPKFNPYGEQVIKEYYKAHSFRDISDFIQNIVIEGNDHMKSTRIPHLQNLIVHNKKGGNGQFIASHIKTALK